MLVNTRRRTQIYLNRLSIKHDTAGQVPHEWDYIVRLNSVPVVISEKFTVGVLAITSVG